MPARAVPLADPGGWPVPFAPLTELAKLLASDGENSDWLGWSVAVSGSTIVVGAPNDGPQLEGAAYVFTEPVAGWTGTLTEAAKLVASSTGSDDSFGHAVAVFGDTVVVGAYKMDTANGIQSGAVYVFEKPAGGWSGTLTEDAILLASDGEEGDWLGYAVGMDGDQIVASAPSDNDNGNLTGSAYIFTKPGGGWSGTVNESAKLLASDGAGGDSLGYSAAISGSTVVVGAYADDANAGSAYVFLEPGGGWSGSLNEAAKLLASDGAGGDRFGWAAAVSGDTIVVGALFDDDNGVFSGSAWVFVEPDGGWSGTLTEDAKLLPSDGEGLDNFGLSVDVRGPTVAVGMNNARTSDPGEVYLFTRPGGGWSGTRNEARTLLASDRQSGDRLGSAVAMSEEAVVAGAHGDDSLKGSAYVFTRAEVIFADGFESGDTSAWSATVP